MPTPFNAERCAHLVRLRVLGVLGVLAAASCCASVEAQQAGRPIALRLSGPDWLSVCLNAEKLGASVASALEAEGRAEPQTASLEVDVQATNAPDGRSATLEIRAMRGAQSLGPRVLHIRTTECAALPDAVALMLVLLSKDVAADPASVTAIETARSLRPSTRAPQRPTQIHDRPSPAVYTPRARRPMPAEATAALFKLGAGGSALFGILPQVALGLHVEVETARAALALRLRGSFLWPRTREIAEGSVRFGGYELALHACLNWDVTAQPRTSLRLCLGPGAGPVHAVGRDFRLRNETRSELMLSLGMQLEAALALSASTWLRIEAGSAVAVLRPRFLLRLADTDQTLRLPSPALVRGELGLSLVQIFR